MYYTHVFIVNTRVKQERISSGTEQMEEKVKMILICSNEAISLFNLLPSRKLGY